MRESKKLSLHCAPPAQAREQIEATLRRLGARPDQILLSVCTDINATGEYDEQWLVVTADRLFVFDPQDPADPVHTLDISETAEFRIMPAVGSGLLQARIDDVWIDVIRFSNRLKYTFDRAARRLEQLKRGEELLPDAADAVDPQRCPRCGLMLEFAGELCPRCIDHGAALGRVIRLMRPYWKATAVMMGLLLIGIGLDMVWPLLTRYLVDFVLVATPPDREHPLPAIAGLDARTQLLLVVAALAAVHIVRAIINYITGRLANRVGNAMTFDIRTRLVAKLEELGLSYYIRQETGSLVGRVAFDTEAIQGFMSQLTSGFLMQFLLVLVSFLMMFNLEPRLALWAIVPAPFVIGGAFVYWRYVHPHFQRYWDRSAKQAGLLNGILSGIRVVKAFSQEENELRRFRDTAMEVRRSKDRLDNTSAYFYPLMGVVFQVGGWIIWYVGGLGVLADDISLGTLMAFFGYLAMFYGPLGSLTNLTTWMTQFSTQVHRIFEVLDTPTALPEPQEPVTIDTVDGKIEFRDVTFGYSRGVPVLKNLNFTINPREKIGIVGRSGSGKTSLVNLIFRFFDVDLGEILLDGVDIRRLPKRDLRSQISMVLQEAFLFKGSFSDNISYGMPQASTEDIIAAARAAAAHEFILRHPLGYDTSVGERGQELSGGERQRISVARALLTPSRILIFDEATSAIDSESELTIQNALDDISRERTTIIIAHRLSTLQNCDRIYVLEDGYIVEQGNHRELVERDGRYASWLRIQRGQASVDMDSISQPPHEERRTEPRPEGGGAGLPSIDDYHPRWLRPGTDMFERGARGDLQLNVPGERVYRGVFALRCFPIHYPKRYISLRYVTSGHRAHEVGIIRDLDEWPESARKLVWHALARRYFFHTIQRIHAIRKLPQFLSFAVRTDLGNMEFIMRYTPESAPDYGRKGKLLIDVEDNLYIIPDVGQLPSEDREILNRYVFW